MQKLLAKRVGCGMKFGGHITKYVILRTTCLKGKELNKQKSAN